MRLKTLLVGIALISCTLPAAHAEGIKPNVDRNTIESASRESGYASLLTRFKSGETLPIQDMATVYYGSALAPGFNPDKRYDDVMTSYDSGNIAKAHELAAAALESDPTNLTLLFKAYASAAASTDPAVNTKASVYQSRLLQICDLILASGLGVTDSSPYIVVRPADMDEFLVKYIQPAQIVGKSKIGKLEAAKVVIDGVPDEVILYFNQFK